MGEFFFGLILLDLDVFFFPGTALFGDSLCGAIMVSEDSKGLSFPELGESPLSGKDLTLE